VILRVWRAKLDPRRLEEYRRFQEMLGHATIAITIDTYSQVLPNLQREAVERLETLLRSGANTPQRSLALFPTTLLTRRGLHLSPACAF
jgi:hypothetical protein